jgi:hypothetical protein
VIVPAGGVQDQAGAAGAPMPQPELADLGSYRKDGPSLPCPSRSRLTSAWLLLALKLVP